MKFVVILMILIILIIMMIMMIAMMSRPEKREKPEFDSILSESQKRELYDVMKRFDQVCSDHSIPYFIIGGTLLGSVRHKDFIPWDNDIDVGVMNTDLPRLNALDLSKYGLKSDNFILEGKAKIRIAEHPTVDLDIFGYTRTGEYNSNNSSKGEKIDFSFMPSRSDWPTEYFYENELFPIQVKYQFGDMVLPGPFECIPYFERAWGDWQTPKKKY